MLNIVALTYAGQDGQHLSTDGTPEAQRNRLFAAYMARMFESRPASQRFPKDRTLHWLAWLAWQMQHHNQTVLYLEHLQPDWLPTRSARWHYALLDRVGGGLMVGLVSGLANGGYAYLSHAAQRLVLWQKGAMPRAYVSFLDENAQRILLRNVGGGYIFIHRLLLDYCAKQYTEPETAE